MATRTVSAAGGNWNAVGTWDEGVVPTAEDDVVDAATSGALVINAAAYCRSIELSYSVVTHNSGVTLTVGTTTAKGNGVAVKLGSSYTPLAANASQITVNSTAGQTLTLNFGANYIGRLNLAGGDYSLSSDLNGLSSESYIYHTAGAFTTNNRAISTGMIWGTGTTTRSLVFGSSIVTLSRTGNPAIEMASIGLTIAANTATFKFTGASPRIYAGGNDFNGARFQIEGPTGTMLFGNSCTVKDFLFNTAGAKTVNFTAGVVLTITGELANYSPSGEVIFISNSSGSSFTISKASGSVELYNFNLKDVVFTGGAAFDAYNNCTSVSNVTGVTFHGGEWCMDLSSGDDADVFPYGWWKVAYTSPAGTKPVAGEIVTGAISGATAELAGPVSTIDWAATGGTIYLIKKNGTFQAETINFSGGSSAVIAADLTVTGWKTLTTGALATRIGPGDVLKVKKSPNPTLVDNASVWTTRPATPGSTINITSSTNTSPIQINKVGHGLVSGDVVWIDTHAVNLSANGFWLVEKVNDNAFTLVNSVGIGTGGATGNFTKVNHLAVVLSESHTKNINRGGEEGVWTGGSANYNVTLNTPAQTSRKEGYYAIKVAVLAGAGSNEKAAYFNTPTLNLSGYQQVSFWFNTSIALNAGDFELRLCTDDAGNTAAHTIPIPKIINKDNWQKITVDLGVNLNTAIESVALWQIVDKGACSIYIDHIIACKASSAADSLTLHSLISKSSSAYGGTEAFYPIQSFGSDGRVLVLEGKYNEMFYQKAAYFGTPETVPLYKREAIRAAVPAAYNTCVNDLLDSGTAALPIKIQGGYDPVTNLQDGETYYGSDWNGYAFRAATKSYYEFSRISLVRWYIGFAFSGGVGGTLKDIQTVAQTTSYAISLSGMTFSTLDNIGSIIQYATGLAITGSSSDIEIGTIARIDNGLIASNNAINIDTCQRLHFNGLIGHIGLAHSVGINLSAAHNCRFMHVGVIEVPAGSGIALTGSMRNVFDQIDSILYAQSYYGILLSDVLDCDFRNIVNIDGCLRHGLYLINALYNRFMFTGQVKNNTNYALVLEDRTFENEFYNMHTTGNASGSIYAPYQRSIFRNCKFEDNVFIASTPTAYRNGRLIFEKHNTVADYHYLVVEGGLIATDAVVRHTEADVAWCLSPTSTTRNVDFPLILPLGTLPVIAGTTVTFKIWCKKSHATDIAAQLVCREGQLAGVDREETPMSDTTEWTELSITVTPSETGVLHFEALVWWVANTADESVWFDDMSWS